MSIKGLFPIDQPKPWEAGETACLRCRHSFYGARDTERRYLSCSRWQPVQQCRFQRHETGPCKPEGEQFKARGV